MPQIVLFRFIDRDLAVDGSAEVEWLLNDTPQNAVQCGSLLEFADYARGCRTLLVVAGELVTLNQAKLPLRKRRAWQKAIPYALEDQLADNVEALHFVMAETEPKSVVDGRVAVAVVQHEWLRIMLARCHEVDIEPYAVVPDTLLVPRAANSWSILVDEQQQRCMVRTGFAAGFACELDNVSFLLPKVLQEVPEEARPQLLQAWGEIPAKLDFLEIAIEQQDSTPPLVLFGQAFVKTQSRPVLPVNLLQGVYKSGVEYEQWLRPWRVAAALAGIWLAVQGVQQAVQYWQLLAEQKQLEQEIAAVFRDALPQARRMVNPQAQLENRLRELRAGETLGDATFFNLLQQGGQRLVEHPSVTVNGLRYKDQQLDFILTGRRLETFDQLKQQLGNIPTVKSEMRTSKRDNTVESLLSLTVK